MKQRKALCSLISMVVIIGISGCGSDGRANARTSNEQKSVEEVLQAGMAETDVSSNDEDASGSEIRQNGLTDNAPEPEEVKNESIVFSTTEGIDVDLTSLSSTMVYSEVYNMMSEPKNYIGKKIKMNGQFAVYHDESTGNNYYACIIQDATACCAQGMEFVLTDDYTYPDDYPKEGRQITVVGVFDTYMEGSYMYCTLRDAKLE